MYPLSLCIFEAVVNFNVRADTRKQRRIQAGQEEIGIGDERQTVERESVLISWSWKR